MQKEFTLEKHLTELILDNIKDTVENNTTYHYRDYLYELINDNYNNYRYPNIINYCLNKFTSYILSILVIELCQLNDDKYEDMIDIKEDRIYQIIDKDEGFIEKNEKDMQKQMRTVYNQNMKLCLTYLERNQEINSMFFTINKKTNMVSHHLSSDQTTIQILNLLSPRYLLDDLNTTFDDNYFLNDIGFLFKNINGLYYPLSLKKYLSFLIDKSRLKRNIFTISEHIRCLALNDQLKISKNYIREIKALEVKYNSYINEINDIFNDESLTIYDYLVLKCLFNNFLSNDFFSSLDSNFFDHLSKNIDMVFLYKHIDSENSLELTDKFKIEEMNFNINILKLFMIFNVNLNDFINNSLNTELIYFSTNNHVLYSAEDGFANKCHMQNLLLLIFEIFWNFYTSAGSIINILMNSYFLNDLNDENLKCVFKLLEDRISNKKYNTITFSNLSDPSHKKSQSLLYSYLFLSKTHQNTFYNLHYE